MTSFNSTNAIPPSKLAAKDSNLQEPIVASIDSGPVQAYAKLEGDDFCYYIRTLQVSLGRKVTNPENVDIPLGNTKSVSRQHARLFYNFSTQRFELMVFGKNGAFVNEQFIEKGVTVPLDNKTKIQIGEMAFVFLLPKSDADTVNTNNISTPRNNEFGYISTPHQLEKKLASTINTTKNHEHHNDSNNEDSDLSDDDIDGSISSETNTYNTKDIKPPYSYASLIAQAINSVKDKRMTLNGIYNYITTNYPYYQMTQNGWQNSIRHNLSLNKAFVKVPRGETEPGKGAFWTIDINAETQFTNGVYKRNKRNETGHPHENVKKKVKKDYGRALDDGDEEEEDEKEDHFDIVDDTTQSLSVADVSTEIVYKSTAIKEEGVKPSIIINKKEAKPAMADSAAILNTDTQNSQAQLQLQLQNTIRQHLLDPVRYPLPPSIAELLPQAIAQLPPQLATQLSSTIKVPKTDSSNTSEPSAVTKTEDSEPTAPKDTATAVE